MGEIKELYPKANISVLVMDHTSLQSVVDAATDFLSKETALHGLVNNAGIMATPFKMTGDGYEEQWQTNHIAHWLLTERLLQVMLDTSKELPPGSVRLTNVMSGGHLMAPKMGVNLQDTSLSGDTYSALTRYGQSKLANILHSKTIHKNYGPGSESQKSGGGEIWATSIHPGVVRTNLDIKATAAPWYFGVVVFVLEHVGGIWPADKGAWTNVFCIASPEMKPSQSGLYFERIAKPGSESSKAKNMELAEELDKWTRAEMQNKGFI